MIFQSQSSSDTGVPSGLILRLPWQFGKRLQPQNGSQSLPSGGLRSTILAPQSGQDGSGFVRITLDPTCIIIDLMVVFRQRLQYIFSN